jgi:hypothetical protein
MTQNKPPDQTKHGGEAAIKRIQHDQPFDGLALAEQAAVMDEYEADGRAAMVERQALRLETAARLFWNAICKAFQDDDIAAVDKYIARYGWLAGKSLSAWEYVRKEAASAPGVNAVDVLNVIRGDTDDETE